jgi:hypothetical protein
LRSKIRKRMTRGDETERESEGDRGTEEREGKRKRKTNEEFEGIAA